MIGVIDKMIFRNPRDILSDYEKDYVKDWVKAHFVPNTLVNAFCHPYAKKEWHKQQEKFVLSEKMEKLDRESKNS